LGTLLGMTVAVPVGSAVGRSKLKLVAS
jgi:hypothetical protein